MAFYRIISLLALAASSLAQTVTQSTYTDPQSGLTFQALNGGGLIFGIALPTTPGKDFVGMLALPIAASDGGWGGVVFSAEMVGKMEIVAWPSSPTAVYTGFRVSKNEAPSGTTPYTANAVALTPIASGTYQNATYVVSTFLCKNCINTDSFAASAATFTVSSAISNAPPVDPTNPASQLNDHSGLPSYVCTFTTSKLLTANYAAMAAGQGAAPAAPAAPAASPAPAAAPAPAASPAPAIMPAPSLASGPAAMPSSSPASPPAAAAPAASSPPAANGPAAPAASSPPAANGPAATTAGPWPPLGTAAALAAPNAQPSMACVCTCNPVPAAGAPAAAAVAQAVAQPVNVASLSGGIDSVPSPSPSVSRRDGGLQERSGAGSSTRAGLIGGGAILVFSLGGLLFVLQGMMIL